MQNGTLKWIVYPKNKETFLIEDYIIGLIQQIRNQL